MKQIQKITGFRWIWYPGAKAWWMEAIFEVQGLKATFRRVLIIDRDNTRTRGQNDSIRPN